LQPPSVPQKLKAALDANEYLADIFVLLHLDETQLGTDASPSDGSPILLVPESIDKVFTGEATEADELLLAMLLWGRRDSSGASPVEMARVAATIRERYMALRQRELVRTIPDESDPEIAAAVAIIFPEPPQKDGFLGRLSRTVRTSVTTVLSVSRRTGQSILMRGRDLSRLIRARISQLELPARADDLAEKKVAFSKRLYAFKGGKGAKAFVGIVLAVNAG
jgi:hypothetical protein